MSTSNTSGSLRPAWNRGNSKGFQPPPQVEQQPVARSNSSKHSDKDRHNQQRNHNNHTSQQPQRDNYNKFSALDIDDDDVVLATTTPGASSSNVQTSSTTTDASKNSLSTTNNATSESNSSNTANATTATNSRSEAFQNAGRSLADLAATRAPVERTSSRFSNLRSSSTGESMSSNTNVDVKGSTAGMMATAASSTPVQQEEKVIRYTREKLLSMRPAPLPAPPEFLLRKELEGSLIISDEPQDPVCWDNLDAEKIWSTVPVRRGAVKDDANPVAGSGGSLIGSGGTRRSSGIVAGGGTQSLRREASTGNGGGRWQRGVALPPEGSVLNLGGTKQHRSNRDIGGSGHYTYQRDAENPNDLWDDPASSGDGALMDFSAFGDSGGAGGDNDGTAFDFDKMAEASKKLEEELRGEGRTRSQSQGTNESDDDGLNVPLKVINPNRPLATAGTTIRSGSGDHVNVFEDFDDPGAVTEEMSGTTKVTEETTPSSESPLTPTIKAANEDPSASSRLMAMIGVKKDDTIATDASLTAWGEPAIALPLQTGDSAIRVSLNPWGDPIGTGSAMTNAVPVIPVVPNVPLPNSELHQQGLDLQARLRQAEMDQKMLEENRRVQEDLQRQQKEQERARLLQQQQQAGVQSQVELVLMERISAILESSWGRLDLMSILKTLHTEDTRVIPLLSNIDSLRALIIRNPRRIALRQDPSVPIEMAQLLITNAQWHAQQQQQEELQRLEQQRRMEEQQKATARAQQQQLQQPIIPDAPWYYSDPSKNIQGPFRGEEMRQWLEAGYFKGDLPISQNPTGPFRPLAVIFSDLSVAFANPKPVNANMLAERNKAVEQQRREQAERARIEASAAEHERRRAEDNQREKEAAVAMEQQRQQKARIEAEAALAAEHARNANGENDSSNKLKLMLGLGTATEAQQQVSKKATGKMEKQQQKSNDESFQQQTIANESSAPIPSVKPVAPAWGGAAVSQSTSKKSMSEIQKEEARAAATAAAMNRQGAKPASSGWANVAAGKGGSTGWTAGSARQQPAAVVSTPITTNTVQRSGPSRSVSLQPKSVAVNSAMISGSVPPTPGLVQRANSAAVREPSTAVDTDAFGAKMDPTLEKWCKDQMNKLNGTDDLTLVAFCMSLTDSEEIRQYLTAYLGSTPQVNAFATEFIQRMGGNEKKNVEEWESTATAKKGKKKKVGA